MQCGSAVTVASGPKRAIFSQALIRCQAAALIGIISSASSARRSTNGRSADRQLAARPWSAREGLPRQTAPGRKPITSDEGRQSVNLTSFEKRNPTCRATAR